MGQYLPRISEIAGLVNKKFYYGKYRKYFLLFSGKSQIRIPKYLVINEKGNE